MPVPVQDPYVHMAGSGGLTFQELARLGAALIIHISHDDRAWCLRGGVGNRHGDGAPDVIIAIPDAKDILLINNGSGVFSIDTNFNLPGAIEGSSDIRFVDLNGDGDLDIITTNNNDAVGAGIAAAAIERDSAHGTGKPRPS